MSRTQQVQANPNDGLWDKKQTARFFGVSPFLVDRWCSRGGGPRYVKVGPLVRFRPSDVFEFLESNIRGGSPDAS